jgi:hypothetical protein
MSPAACEDIPDFAAHATAALAQAMVTINQSLRKLIATGKGKPTV